jgi:hypothetical protein
LAAEKEYINITIRGSLVVINSVSWIRIRTDLALLDPDPYYIRGSRV